jgi:hypothetical protein
MAKSKPIGVRFDLEILELIKKEQDLETPQGVLNYLMNNYRGKPSANKPAKVAAKPSKKETTPPANLKGIDLAIWKAEQKK